MTLTEMESLFENIDARLIRIEQFLPTVATKDDLARFATKDDLAPFATKDDLRGVRVLVEDTNSKIQWLAEGLASVIELASTIPHVRERKPTAASADGTALSAAATAARGMSVRGFGTELGGQEPHLLLSSVQTRSRAKLDEALTPDWRGGEALPRSYSRLSACRAPSRDATCRTPRR